MTLKGHKSHYNVKLLRGYGISINVKNNQLILKNGQNDITGISEKEEWFVSKIPYEKIVISGKGYVSTEAIFILNQNNVNVLLTDTYGNPVSFMNGGMVSNTAIKYRMGQYDTFRDPVKVLQLQKWILKEKIQSQINFFKRLENHELQDGITKLEHYHSQIDSKTNLKELIKIEAGSGRHYFLNYAKLIPTRHGFQSRRGGGIVNSKRYASDVINALLNYGYTVLAGEIAKFVNGMGLDPYYGFYHKPDTSFQALVYDLIEPFRWLVEYSVYKFSILDRNGIRFKDYTHARNGNVVMDSDLIRRFLEVLERKLQSERPYKFKHGLRREDGMSMCQEITIVKLIVQRLYWIYSRSNKVEILLYSKRTMEYTTEEKSKLDAANVVGLDTKYYRNLFLNTPEIGISMLKSALLISKVYLPDNQIIDNPAIVSLYRNLAFRQLLLNDYDGHPAIVMGLRAGTNTPIEAAQDMIKRKLNFSILTKFPNIQEAIQNDKITTPKEFFDSIDEATGNKKLGTYATLEEISKYFETNEVKIWRAEYKEGQYFDLINTLVTDIVKNEENVDADVHRISTKFLKTHTEDKRLKYNRSKAENDLYKIIYNTEKPLKEVPAYQVGTPAYDFEKMIVDASYNYDQSFMNPRSLIWQGNLSAQSYSRTFERLLKKNGFIHGLKPSFSIDENVVKSISELLNHMSFEFIYELRTGINTPIFQKNIRKINEAKTEQKREEAIKDHLNWVFDYFINHPTHGKKLREKYIKKALWKSITSINSVKKNLDLISSIGGLSLLGLKASTIGVETYEIERFVDVAAIAGSGMFVVGMTASYGQLGDVLRYHATTRLQKQQFSSNLIKELTMTYF